MAGDLTLRLATPADAATIARHRTRMFLEMRGWPDEAGADLLAALRDVLPPMLADGTYRGWFVVDGAGAIVAGAGVQVRPLLPRLETRRGLEALVVNVYVEPPYRRRGLARRLMAAILDWCAGEGIERVALHPSDAGKPLYERLGFAPSGELIRQLRV